MLKAIETEYNNTLFRSRLEARWAVFFDMLDIKWEYEHEGYDLYGIRYLPDFWLPKQDCFIEIKGKRPVKDEINKANLLALASGKKVYIFFGDINVPKTENDINTQKYSIAHGEWWYQVPVGFDPSDRSIIGHNTTSQCYHQKCLHGDQCPNHVEIHVDNDASEALYVAEILHSPGDSIKYQLGNNGELQSLVPRYGRLVNGKDHFIGRFPQPLPPIIREHANSILQIIRTKPITWVWGVGGMSGILYPNPGYFWSECSNCMALSITGYKRRICVLCGYSASHNSTRLVAAYRAARQERFEHRRKG